jgi:RNA polymerase sigma factor (sigma-70 family)
MHLIHKGVSSVDEIKLAKQAINGDEHAQIQLLQIYEGAMYKVAFSYLKNEHDAYDALSEMTIQALKNMYKVKSPEYLKTWLVRIVINTCLQMMRKQKNIVITESFPEQSSQYEELFSLNAAISKLSVKQQELIHLKYFRDLKNSEIATIQQIPEGTVKSRLHMTLRKLKTILREEDQI